MMAEIALRYPMRLDDRGRVVATRNVSDIWGDRIRVLLSTYAGERAGRPEYGTDVETSLFSGIEDAVDAVSIAAQQAIVDYLPELEGIDVRAFESAPGRIGVQVSFTPPNARATSVSTAVDIALLGLS